MSGAATRRIRVSGRVQGVWFRGWTEQEARALGLDGWVRNRRDGSVEILVTGEEAAVQRLIALCREGPAAARVERVEVEESDEETAPGFSQRATF
jgi:acylphosphatase